MPNYPLFTCLCMPDPSNFDCCFSFSFTHEAFLLLIITVIIYVKCGKVKKKESNHRKDSNQRRTNKNVYQKRKRKSEKS